MVNFFRQSKKKQLSTAPLTVAIERLDVNGCGVARYQNKPVFIAGTIPGEQVLVKVTEQKSKYARASLLDIIHASPDRVAPGCRHFEHCGGCDIQHMSAAAQLCFKQQKVSDLFNRYGITDVLPWQDAIAGDAYHYRRKARIGVQYNKQGEATIGFRKKSTNQLQPIKACPVLVVPLTDIFVALNTLINRLSLPKAIGHIEVIATEHLTLVIRQLVALNQADTTSWLHFAASQHCQIMIDDGVNITPLSACQPLHYADVNDISIGFSPADFIQVNSRVNQQMVLQAIDWLQPNGDDMVLDLFCGLGNFSLPIAKKVQQLTGVEGVNSMVVRAQQNAELNHISNAEFYQADLNSPWLAQPWATPGFTKVILDPARAGAFVAVQQLVTMRPSKILYVSCDPDSLAKDSQLLIGAGYHIKKIAIMEMFSQTKHIETMVLFSA